MITIDILPSVPEDQQPVLPQNAFVLRAYAVFDDGYEINYISLPNIPKIDGYESELEEAVRMLKTMVKTDLEDDIMDYSHIDGFSKWFDNGSMWPMNPNTDYDDPGRCDGYDIMYYDANSVIHRVKLTLETA